MRTVDLPRICALRMRVSISPRGSFIDICPLPARFDHAGDLAERAELAQHDPRQFQFTVIRVRTAGQLAAVVQTRGRRVARQFSQFQAGLEALFHRQDWS